MTHFPARRPRFERTPVRGIRLTSRDRELLRAIQRHRLLRSTHLAALAGGSGQAVRRRLQLLFHHGYLDRPPTQLDWYTRGSEPLVYALGDRGAELLAANDEASRSARRDAKNRRLSRPFLRHTLAVADSMVDFELACRWHKGVSLIQPEEVLARAPQATRRLRQPFRWWVDLPVGSTSHRLGVEPDWIFGLCFKGTPVNRRQAFFFLEADRGTMPVVRKELAQTSFVRKLHAYHATWRQRRHVTHLGIPNFRVLTVTPNNERLERLVAASRTVGGGARLFLFAVAESIGSSGILAHEWVDSRGEVTRLTRPLGMNHLKPIPRPAASGRV